jgi:hypothetical protein
MSTKDLIARKQIDYSGLIQNVLQRNLAIGVESRSYKHLKAYKTKISIVRLYYLLYKEFLTKNS